MITLFRPDEVYALEQVKPVMAEHMRQMPGHITPIGTASNMIRYELPIEKINILYWLHNQRSNTKIYWSERDEDFETGGVGIANCVKGDGLLDHEEVFAQMKSHLSKDNPHLRYYGGTNFDLSAQDKEWKPFGTYQFIVPQFEIVSINGKTLFAFNIAINEINEENMEKAISALQALSFSPETTFQAPPKVLTRNDLPNQDGWKDIFSNIDRGLQSGSYAKIVLARKSIFDFNVRLRPSALMKHLKSRTPNSFHFCFQPCAGSAFLGATPELLYKREGRKIWSEAIAGTRPRGENDTEDQELESQLLNSEKDAREHQYVVNVIRATLKNFCTELKSDKDFRLKKLKGSQHLHTLFEGTLVKDIQDDRLLPLLHPTPAVGGYPIQSAIDVIKTSEPFNRGWYAGPVGYIGHDAAEFAVAIRSGLIDRDRLSLYAGAGIVTGSTAQSEWDEIENKISNFIKVFNKET